METPSLSVESVESPLKFNGDSTDSTDSMEMAVFIVGRGRGHGSIDISVESVEFCPSPSTQRKPPISVESVESVEFWG